MLDHEKFRYHKERILILVKTYPTPSAKYVETVCVAGINDRGEFRRLYPVPFRSMDEEQQFKKWQWIDANVLKASYAKKKDNRPESHKIDVDSVSLLSVVDTSNQWRDRMNLLEKHISPSFCKILEEDSNRPGRYLHTLAIIRPKKIDLVISEGDSEWSEEELHKLQKDQQALFNNIVTKSDLEKIPYIFRYKFKCHDENCKGHNLPIIDWEAGMLYRNCKRLYGSQWKKYFKQKYQEEFSKRDTLLFLGNMHRFPKNWLIVGIISAPSVEGRQLPLI